MNPKIWLAGLLALPFFCMAQHPACDSLQVEQWIKTARNTETETQIHDIAAALKHCDNLADWYRLYYTVGAAYREKDNYEQALYYFQYALQHAWKTPEGEKEWMALAKTYANIGYVYKKINIQTNVVQYYEMAAAIFTDKLHKSQDAYLAKKLYSELGNAYSRLRDFEKAIFYNEKRKEILLSLGLEPDAAGAYNDLGVIYMQQQDYERASQVLQEGLALPGIDPYIKIDLLVNSAFVHIKSGAFPAALSDARQAEQLVNACADLSPKEKATFMVDIYDNYGAYFLAKKAFAESKKYYDLKLEASLAIGKNAVRSHAMACITRANMYLEQEKTDWAMADFSRALAYLIPDFMPRSTTDLPEMQQLTTDPTLIDALGGMAACYTSKSKAEPSGQWEEKARQCFQLAEIATKNLWQTYTLDGSKLKSAREHRWVKALQQSFLFDQWQQEQSDEIAEELFNVSEQSRANLLREGLENTRLFQSDSMWALRMGYSQVSQEIEALENELREKIASNNPSDATSLLLMKARDRRAGILRRAARSQTIFNRPERQRKVDLSAIRQQLKKGEALVAYFIEDSTAFFFVIDPETAHLMAGKLHWDKKLAYDALTLKEDIIRMDNRAYADKAWRLYEQLLKPVCALTAAEHLIIVPDGVLWNLPFDALLTADVPDKDLLNFKQYPYLLNSKSISYAFSAALQMEMCDPASRSSRLNLIAYAPEYSGDVLSGSQAYLPARYAAALNSPLSFNKDEATAISRLFGGWNILGKAASKQDFLHDLRYADILHVAAHAEADFRQPERSSIVFSYGSAVYANELANQLGPLEMAVLSGCETGTGQLWQGEGMLSLARVFALTGTRSIVASLWRIEDKSTHDIMVSFYQYLKKGLGKEEALRKAKLDYLLNAPDQERAHPLFWAAFTPIGNMEPLETDGLGNWGAGICAFLVLLLAFLVLGAQPSAIRPGPKQ